jgi:methylated-DNA-[protein]-cysteine S-methyltransferase
MPPPSPLTAQARLGTPLGPLTLAATSRGLAGAWFDGQKHHPGPLDAPVDATQPHIAQAMAELQRYFAGQQSFATPLDPQGTPFQRSVWAALRDIAPGCTRSYGQPRAVRAVGAAVGRNPLSIIVPCHRVLGHDGSLTGYAGGLTRKQALLALERPIVGRIPAVGQMPAPEHETT